MEKAGSIEKYFSKYEGKQLEYLKNMRAILFSMFSIEVEECISYGIPTLKYQGKNIVHYGAFKNHLGFYPGSKGIKNNLDKLKGYKTSKGAVQFPLDQELPISIIDEIVQGLIKDK